LPQAPHPLIAYKNSVGRIHATNLGTAETSYYPALNSLFQALGDEVIPKLMPLSQLSDKSVEDNTYPDFGLLERHSHALVLPVEAKPVNAKLETLAISTQTRDYAKTYGGGLCLITNLWQFSLVRLDRDDKPVEDTSRRVSIAASGDEFLNGHLTEDLDGVWSDLRVLLIEAGRPRGSITAPKQVANLLAYHARRMRDAINGAGDPDEMLASLRSALNNGLHIELSGEHLVPTVVQTLVYGVFAAWLETDEPDNFDWMQASYRSAVPVFAEILHEALRPALLRECDLVPHLKNVESVLHWTDRETFTAQFDGDAIQYFYEPFLAEFDPVLRGDLGVWYTPREIADYQVARSHHHLVSDLGVAEGLADPNVYLLDPAVGTGTYLISACDFLVNYHKKNGEPDSVAAHRALDALLTRFIGFEVLPAAFIICHLHLARHLQQLHADPGDRRLRVYLTNSLTGWKEEDAAQGSTLFPELEEELRDAAIAKQSDPIMVVLGNPPYQGYSTAETNEEKQMMAEWSKESSATWGLRKHRLNDLYVRFWRISIHRIITLTRRGVVSFITNRKWIGGRSYPAMRATIVEEFDQVWVDDLHGGAHDRSVAVDQSIFTTAIAAGIKVGTAIVTAVRTDTHSANAVVHLADYRGTAATKRAELKARWPEGMGEGYSIVEVAKETRYRFSAAPSGDYPALDEYLTYFNSGVQPVRDEAVLATNKQTLEHRMRDYFDFDTPFDAMIETHPGFNVSRARYVPKQVRDGLKQDGASFEPSRVVRLLYRPFELRWMYWETRRKLLNEARGELLPYWRNVESQVCLVAAQTPRRVTGIRPIPSRAVGCMECVDPNARVFPLYGPDMDQSHGETDRLFEAAHAASATMVVKAWSDAATKLLGLDEKQAGEAIFHALVALTNSPCWLDEQPVESDDFATVPLPADPSKLLRASEIGRELVDLFDGDTPVVGVTVGSIREELRTVATADSVPGAVAVEGRYGVAAGRRNGLSVIWSGEHGWRNISDDVWSFAVGGFQVLPKWLSYRTRDGLTESDREQFRMICRRIAAIRMLEKECDGLYADAQSAMLMVE
jgi:hypothetical protein